MTNYSTLCGQLKEGILKFSEKLCVGLSLPKLKFVSDMLFGITKAQSVMLTDVDVHAALRPLKAKLFQLLSDFVISLVIRVSVVRFEVVYLQVKGYCVHRPSTSL